MKINLDIVSDVFYIKIYMWNFQINTYVHAFS
jgi:hypothetical protein